MPIPFGIFRVHGPDGAFVAIDSGRLDRIEARWPPGSRFECDHGTLVDPIAGEVVADGVVRPIPSAPVAVVPDNEPPTLEPPKAMPPPKPMGRYVRDRDEIETHARAVVEAHPAEVQRYRKGKVKLVHFFVAKVMERTQGGADPQVTQAVLAEVLGPVAV